MRIRTILAAAAAPLAIGGVLLTTTAASASTGNGNGPGQSISAYYWQPNGHALTGSQAMPGGAVPLSGGYLAKVTEKTNNLALNRGDVITITGTVTPGSTPFQTNPDGQYPAVGPNFRIFFEGGSAGTNPSSPHGYETQAWWVNGTTPVVDDVDLNTTTGTFTLTATVDPSVTTWNDWNGSLTTDPATATAFLAAASHVRALGVSVGGGFFYENGVTGPGSIQIAQILVNGNPVG